MSWHYLIWIPITIVYNAILCWLSLRYNAKDFLKAWVSMSLVSLVPTWSIAAYYSKDLIFDGLVFDTTLVLSSPFIFYFLGQGQAMGGWNWVGVGMVVFGLFLTRWHFGVAH